MRLPLAITRDCAICFDVSSRISQTLSFGTSEYYIAEFLDIVKKVPAGLGDYRLGVERIGRVRLQLRAIGQFAQRLGCRCEPPTDSYAVPCCAPMRPVCPRPSLLIC